MSSTTPTTKLQPTQSNTADPAATSKPATAQPALLEEDDEFEDFPVEGSSDPQTPLNFSSPILLHLATSLTRHSDWTQEESEMPGGTTHLWEESWDDDDENEDFSKQLREELKKVEGSK